MRIPFLPRHGPVTLRAARSSDAGDLAVIHAKSFAHPWSALTFEQMLTEKNIIGHVAEGRNVIGFILSRIAADEAEVLSIVVASGNRGSGYGHRLLAENIRSLVHQRVDELFLEVEEGNTAALALYKRVGFEKTGTRKGYYHGVDGARRDAITMRKDLRDEVAVPPTFGR